MTSPLNDAIQIAVVSGTEFEANDKRTLSDINEYPRKRAIIAVGVP